VQPDEALGVPAGLGELPDRQRGRGRRQHGVVGQVRAEALPDLRLGERILDDRLDHERRVRQHRGVAADEHVAVDAGPQALADRVDLRVGLVAGALGAGEYGYVALGGGDGRQSARNGPGSRNCQTLRHGRSFRLIDSSVNA
jgi:hypothetical protein